MSEPSAPIASPMSKAPMDVVEHPEDYELVPDSGWRLDMAGRRCRYMERRRQCGRPSVAALRRGKGGWYAYCEDHLYGRAIVNGQICFWRKIGGYQG